MMLPDPLAESNPGLEAAREQVNRILASETLRASEVLRRLLRFLADKTFSGEAEHLKEYSVGLDALGKPPTYDPRQDSGVRLQASRLRQKLDDYYRHEGASDLVTIELPKGKFKITWQVRNEEVSGPASPPFGATAPVLNSPSADAQALAKWRVVAYALSAVSLTLAIWLITTAGRTESAKPGTAKSTPELEALWGPLFLSSRHLIIVYSDPVFVRFERSGSPDILYRRRFDPGWTEATSGPDFSLLQRSLGNPPARPSFDYAMRGELVSTFTLGQFFASKRGNVSLSSLGNLSWPQFADNDVVLLAPRYRIDEHQKALPVQLAFLSDAAGIRNLHPLPGEPDVYDDPQEHFDSDGETLELISVIPGPLGRTRVQSFTGNRAWGVAGSVQSLIDPSFARLVVAKLRASSGQMPLYYQVILRIRYHDGTPTTAAYVTHRVLSLVQISEGVR